MKSFYSRVAALFLVLCLSACSIWKEKGESIEGTWFIQQPVDAADSNGRPLVSRYEISFRSDHTFQSAILIANEVTDNVLGYRFAGDGIFETKDAQLIRRNLRQLWHDDNQGLYSPLTELTSSRPDSQPSIVTFKIANDTMTWTYPPCGPNENCIGTQSFRRKH